MRFFSMSLAAVSITAFILSGCFGTEAAKDSEKNEKSVKAAAVSARQLGTLSSQAVDPTLDLDFQTDELVSLLRSYGVCSKFITVFEDIMSCVDTENFCQGGLPSSVIDYLSCFGIDPYSLEDQSPDVDMNNIGSLDACICGGVGSIFGNFAYAYYNGPGQVTGKSYSPPGNSASETYSPPSSAAGEVYSPPGNPTGSVYHP
jgi:hypothetical protein